MVSPTRPRSPQSPASTHHATKQAEDFLLTGDRSATLSPEIPISCAPWEPAPEKGSSDTGSSTPPSDPESPGCTDLLKSASGESRGEKQGTPLSRRVRSTSNIRLQDARVRHDTMIGTLKGLAERVEDLEQENSQLRGREEKLQALNVKLHREVHRLKDDAARRQMRAPLQEVIAACVRREMEKEAKMCPSAEQQFDRQVLLQSERCNSSEAKRMNETQGLSETLPCDATGDAPFPSTGPLEGTIRSSSAIRGPDVRSRSTVSLIDAPVPCLEKIHNGALLPSDGAKCQQVQIRLGKVRRGGG